MIPSRSRNCWRNRCKPSGGLASGKKTDEAEGQGMEDYMKQNRMILAATSVVAVLFLLTVGAPPASADTFHFTSCHLSAGCGTVTDFGTVTLSDNGTGGVLFDIVLNSGNTFAETGAGAGQLFLFNDTLSGSTVTGITATFNGATVAISGGLTGVTDQIDPKTGGGALHANGTGDFTAGVSCTTSSSCNGTSGIPVNDLHFTFTNATLSQLETTNPNGNLFVADIFLGQTGGTNSTGPVDVNTTSTVPDGGVTVMLLGGVLVGIETLRRRIRA
jgi:hypothetical protein